MLEMGEPVRIIELAEAMIRLSGLEPERDIAIEIIGARPGEKFYEDLFNPYERPQPTPAQKILRARTRALRPRVGRARVCRDQPARPGGRRGRARGPRGTARARAQLRRASGRNRLCHRAPGRRVWPSAPARNWPPRGPVDSREPKVPLSFALSISHFVSSVGADAGFAALIGLAILVLLYFAHARETSNLRSELLEATQRLEQLERRQSTGVSPTVAPRPSLARQAEGAAEGGGAVAAPVAAAPLAAAPPAAVGGAPSGASTGPLPPPGGPALAPPAGVGAPPLTDATRVVPGVEEEAAPSKEVPDERPAEAPVAAVPLAAPQGTGAGPSPRPAGPPAPPPPGLGGATAPGLGRTPAPMTAAAGGNGISPIGASAGAPRSLLEHGLPGRRRSPAVGGTAGRGTGGDRDRGRARGRSELRCQQHPSRHQRTS